MSRPQAGKIHALPIKVSYLVEGQGSYCTVLNERHDVFVHPPLARSSSRLPSGQVGGGGARSRNWTPARTTNADASTAGGRAAEAFMGSCCLRDVAWGVCYASPECVPSPRYHDFSVYTLDPSRPLAGPSRLGGTAARVGVAGNGSGSNANTPLPAHRRISHQGHAASSPLASMGAGSGAGPSGGIGPGTSPLSHPQTPVNGPGSAFDPDSTPTAGVYAWHGKGFLSWALYEPPPYPTLIRGRLVQSTEFEGVAVEGGLEGLMAAAAAAEREGSSNASDAGKASRRSSHGGGNDDEEGEEEDAGPWGLEVELTLKMVHLGGRDVGDKKEFGEMIARGKDVAGSSPAVPMGPIRPVSSAYPAAPLPASRATAVAPVPGHQYGVGKGVQRQHHVSSPAVSNHSASGPPAHQQRQHQPQVPARQTSQRPNTAQPPPPPPERPSGPSAGNGQGPNRATGPRRIEPQLLSQAVQGSAQSANGSSRPATSQASNQLGRAGTTVPQTASGKADGPVRPGSSSRTLSAASGANRLGHSSSTHGSGTGATYGSTSTPMEQSSSSQSQPRGHLHHTGSSSSTGFAVPSDPGRSSSNLPSSSGGMEGMFGSDSTPRAQRDAGGTYGGQSQQNHPSSALSHHNTEPDEGHDDNDDDPDREVTPPPIQRPMGPPCTPGARAALAALLGPDGRMSPTAVKALANSSTFRKLLAQAPSPIKGIAGGVVGPGGKDGSLRSPFCSSSLAGQSLAQTGRPVHGDMGAQDPSNPFLSHPPAFTSGSHAGLSKMPVPLTKPSPAASDINTPASVASVHIKPDPAPVGADGQPVNNAPNGGGCDNCGTLYSEQWRNKRYRNGTQMTVCNDCGLYFNAHKKMRPRELWGGSAGGNEVVGQQPGVKMSVQEQEQQSDDASSKRAKVEGPAGIRSSPRKNAAGMSAPTTMSGDASNSDTGVTDSPRRKKRPPPPPSPRRATRAAVKENPGAFPDVDLDSIFGASSHGPGNQSAANHHVDSNGLNAQNYAQSQAGQTNINTDSMGGTNFNLDPSFNNLQANTGGGSGSAIDNNIDFDAILAQFVNEGGDVGQIWNDLNMGMMADGGMMGMEGMMGMDGMDSGMNMNLGMGVDVGMGMHAEMGMHVGTGAGTAAGDATSSGQGVGQHSSGSRES